MDDHGSTISNEYCDPLMSILAPEFPRVTLFGPFTEKSSEQKKNQFLLRKEKKRKEKKNNISCYLYSIDVFDNSMKIKKITTNDTCLYKACLCNPITSQEACYWTIIQMQIYIK